MAKHRAMLQRCQGRLEGALELISRLDDKADRQTEGLVNVVVSHNYAVDVLLECRRLLCGMLNEEDVGESHVRFLLTRINRALGREKR